MKVLHVIPAIAPIYGGTSKLVIDLCGALNDSTDLSTDQAAQAKIVTTNANDKELLDVTLHQWTDYLGVQTLFFEKPWTESYKYSAPMAKWLNSHVDQFDLVHIHVIFSHSTLAAGQACMAKDIPFIITPHGSLDPWSMKRKNLLKRGLLLMGLSKVLEQAKFIHYTTELEKTAVESHAKLSNGCVLTNAIVPIEKPLKDEGKVFELENYILYLGRLHKKKKLHDLIRSFAEVLTSSQSENLKLVIAGTGDDHYLESLRSLAKELNCESNISFPGWVEGERKADLFFGAKMFILISQNENYGLSVAEAMSAGVPVLVNKGVYIYPEIIEHDAGWVCEDDKALAECMSEALSDKKRSLEKAENAKQLVEQNYLWPSVSARMIKIYKQAIQFKESH